MRGGVESHLGRVGSHAAVTQFLYRRDDHARVSNYLTACLLDGYDFAKGSRFRDGFPENKPAHRVVGNWIITLTFNFFFFARYTDLCSGYNAFWKKKMVALDSWSNDGFENEPLINARIRKHHLKVIEVAHDDPGRISGDVKEESWRQGTKAIKSILRERFRG